MEQCSVYQDIDGESCTLPVFGKLKCPVWFSKDHSLTPDSFITVSLCKKHYIKMLANNWYE